MDLYSLLNADEPTAQEKAAAYAQALRRDKAAGLLAAMTGNKLLAPVGQSLQKDAAAGEQDLQQVGQFRLSKTMQAQQLAEQRRQHDAQMRRMDAQTSLERDRLNREDWAAVPDPTGGVIMFNKRTGQQVRTGGGVPGPGGLPPPKPKDLENDVQGLGKDLEPIAKIQPDLATLQSAAAKGNVAGFGPVEGYVPNFVASNEGVANRQAAGRIMAGIIQMISGQAASEKEVARLLEANGLGRNATDAQFKEGVARLGDQYKTLVQQREAKYHPAVVDTYAQRGGFTSKAAPAAAPKRIKVDAEGNVIP